MGMVLFYVFPLYLPVFISGYIELLLTVKVNKEDFLLRKCYVTSVLPNGTLIWYIRAPISGLIKKELPRYF